MTYPLRRTLQSLLLICSVGCATQAPGNFDNSKADDAEREANAACDVRLDQWMFDCIELNAEDELLEDAIAHCEGGAIDGEPLERDEICDFEDTDCLSDLADNAEDCSAAVGLEFAPQGRQANPACDARLDQWMFDCVERNAEDELLEDAVSFCEGGAIDGEPLEIDEICDFEDTDCLSDLADNAEDCSAAIGLEFAPEERQANPACDARLDQWMFDCVERNAEDELLEDAVSFCEGGAIDGEPLEIDEICDFEDTDCLSDLADNAEDCSAAVGLEFES